jgi:hypothetical protein
MLPQSPKASKKWQKSARAGHTHLATQLQKVASCVITANLTFLLFSVTAMRYSSSASCQHRTEPTALPTFELSRTE